MTKCTNCKRSIPGEYLSPIVTGDGVSQEVCGICALKMSNEYLGISRKRFQGETAELMRQMAIKHYRNTNQS